MAKGSVFRSYQDKVEQAEKMRKTSLALKYLSEAISHPGFSIKVYDPAKNHSADMKLLAFCALVAARLELQGFSFDHREISLKYTPTI